jgi:hypothetical protein
MPTRVRHQPTIFLYATDVMWHLMARAAPCPVRLLRWLAWQKKDGRGYTEINQKRACQKHIDETRHIDSDQII